MISKHRAPKTQNNYTPEQLREIKTDRENGCSLEYLSEKYNRTTLSLRRKLSLHGIKKGLKK